MKRVFWILVLGAGAAWALLYVVRLAERRSTSDIAALLPRDTVVFALLPDFNAARSEWHRSDIYQIYREPAVQEFLQKPASRASRNQDLARNIQDIEELDPKDMFVAVTSIADQMPKVAAGFRFHSSQQVVDRLMAKWRGKINPSAKQEKVAYQNHEIELFRQSAFTIAWVQDRKWIFAANDIEEIKALLDRADGRVTDPETLLRADEPFRDAIDEMPSNYALLVYLQPKALRERLAAVRGALGSQAANQRTLLEQIRSACVTTRFDNGKMHDVIFVGMPKQEQQGELTRNSVALGTRATFLYAVTLVNLSKQIELLGPSSGANILGAGVQKLNNALAAAGVATADWEKAFSSEIAMLCDWPEQTRWPSLLITSAVKDEAQAQKITEAVLKGIDEDGRWQETDRDGVRYWSLATTPSLFAIRPVVGLSKQLWVVGLDAASVEAAMQRNQKSGSELADSENYRRANRLVPAPSTFFGYLDPALLYSRLDATLRPILLMGAAFMPASNEYVDLNKLPPPEAITRHLSPIVSSQYYSGKGYIGESIGPLTLNQTGIGVGLLGALATVGYQRHMPGGLNWLGVPGPAATPKPLIQPASPSPSPPNPAQTP